MTFIRVSSILVVLALGAGVRHASAQSWPRFEVGAQVSTLRLTGNVVNAGLGGRVSYDLSRWFAVEGELNLFPRDRVDVRSGPVEDADLRLRYSRRRFDAFGGPKVGIRLERFGVFAKAQPGFARLTDKGVDCLGEDCARVLFLLALPEYRTEFAMNLGGVVEYYPTSRFIARLDLGTTLIRHRSFAPPCADCTTRNFSSRVGIGVRF